MTPTTSLLRSKTPALREPASPEHDAELGVALPCSRTRATKHLDISDADLGRFGRSQLGVVLIGFSWLGREVGPVRLLLPLAVLPDYGARPGTAPSLTCAYVCWVSSMTCPSMSA